MNYEEILTFWFGAERFTVASLDTLCKRWFQGGADFDSAIGESFGSAPKLAGQGVLDEWLVAPRSALALILVLDQFPRNLYRNTSNSFAYDEQARQILRHCLDHSFDESLHPVERVFLYLPFEHAEDLVLQDQCVSLFSILLQQAPSELEAVFQGFLDYAIAHRDVIVQFGRFPHRNEILGRPDTQEESDYLAAGGRRF